MTIIHLSSFTPASRLAAQRELTTRLGEPDVRAAKAGSGKPYLQTPQGQILGLSISHVRRASFPLSLMAVSKRADFAIDVESWPAVQENAAFLTSIIAPEDKAFVEGAKSLEVDPAITLWAAKEGALKASGEVMTDPRDVAIVLDQNGHVTAKPSAAARAPFPEARLNFFRLTFDEGGLAVLLVVAFLVVPTGNEQPQLRFSTPGIKINVLRLQ